MRRAAFTLMEMLVSVVLIVLITLFMYGAIAGSRQTTQTLSRHAGAENNRTLRYELLYRDILEALSVKPLKTKNRRFTIIKLQTGNSLYDIAAPHVIWYVNAQSHRLVRLESAQPITLPISYEREQAVHADAFADAVTDFNLYAAKVVDSNATRVHGTENNVSKPAEAEANSTIESPVHSKRFLIYIRTEKEPPTLLEIAL